MNETEMSRENRILGKVTWQLIPLLFMMYVAAYLARVNVGFAALEMNRDLGFSPHIFGIGGGIFFVGYLFLQVPGNLIIEKLGVRRWISPLIVLSGVGVTALAFMKNPFDFYLLRMFEGIVQGGFFPGIILYLTYWFPARKRGQVMALFISAAAVSCVVGGPISGLIFKMDHLLGFRGWQWIFLLEGIPLILLGMFFFFNAPDRPSSAGWLDSDEKEWLTEKMKSEDLENRGEDRGESFQHALLNPHVWLLGIIYLLLCIGSYGITLWLPDIIKSSFNTNSAMSSVIFAIPYILSGVGMILIGRHSDSTGIRDEYVVRLVALAALFLTVAAVTGASLLNFAALGMGLFCIYSLQGPFWSIPGSFLKRTAAAAGIAIINSIGNLGGFLGPMIMGYMKNNSHSHEGGIATLAAALFFAMILTLIALRWKAGRKALCT